MPILTAHVGLPLRGVDRTSRSVVAPPENPDEWYASDIQGLRFATRKELRPWPSVTNFGGSVYDLDPPSFPPETVARVLNLRSLRWGDETTDIIRHSQGAGAGTDDGFAELFQGAWTSRSNGINTGSTDDRWGGDVCAGNNGKGFYVFSNRIVGPYKWDGAAADATTIASADEAKVVISFADRCFLMNQRVSGTVQSRRLQWSVPGDANTFTGTGASFRVITELQGDITAATVLDDVLQVFTQRGLIRGAETFRAQGPVLYDPVVKDGIGVWAPDSLGCYNELCAFLSEKGFKSWDNRTFQPIGDPIDDYILSRINIKALNTISNVVKHNWNMIIWALPMDGSALPNELWCYNWKFNHWTRLNASAYFSSPVTAMALLEEGQGLPWNDAFFGANPWNHASLSGLTWADFASGASVQILTGHDDGTTNLLDEAQENTALTWDIETPDFSYVGGVVSERDAFPPTRIHSGDIVTLDSITIFYRTIENATTAYVTVSTDGGQSFSALDEQDGALNLPVGNGLLKASLDGRFSGEQFRVRISSKNPNTGASAQASAKIEDLKFSIRRSGASRAA
jgi:hypothetical protein